MSRAEFARMQREALENYLINLIRTVVSLVLFRNFGHPTDPTFARCFTLLLIDSLDSLK